MKLLIFAGGGGTRFWPLSRENLPKQFVPIQKYSSTLQLSANRIKKIYKWKDIYISTNEKYVKQVKKQLPKLIDENIFTEPARRDVGPAVGMALIRLRKQGYVGPVYIGWADHIIKKEDQYQKLLIEAEKSIIKGDYKAIMWAEKPTFANSNLGWTNFEKGKGHAHKLKGHVYRPNQNDADKYYSSNNWFINTGYSISTVKYLLNIYEKFSPNIYNDLLLIEKDLGTKKEKSTINKIYPNIEKKSFDAVVLDNLPKKDVGVITSNMGWEDPGTLFALKKFLEPSSKNYIKGEGLLQNSKDSLIYNDQKQKMVIGVNLKETIIINTEDVVCITNKEGVDQVKDLLEELKKKKKHQKLL